MMYNNDLDVPHDKTQGFAHNKGNVLYEQVPVAILSLSAVNHKLFLVLEEELENNLEDSPEDSQPVMEDNLTEWRVPMSVL